MLKELLDVAFIFAMIMATVFDCKKREIPMFIFPVSAVAYAGWHYIEGDLFSWWQGAAISAAVMFAVYFVIACFGQCGGADVIMMTCIGWIFGLYPSVFIVAVSGIGSLIYSIIEVCRKKVHWSDVNVPYALPVTVATSILMIIQYYIGGNLTWMTL